MDKYVRAEAEFWAAQWDGTAAGATPFINEILELGFSAVFNDEEPAHPYIRIQVMNDVVKLYTRQFLVRRDLKYSALDARDFVREYTKASSPLVIAMHDFQRTVKLSVATLAPDHQKIAAISLDNCMTNVIEAAQNEARSEPAVKQTFENEPSLPGWYRSVDGNNWMLYSLHFGKWHAHMSNGEVTPCTWDYIAQAGRVELVTEYNG